MDYPKSLAWVGLHDNKFTNGTEDGTVKPSADPAEWANAVTDELLAVISAAGLEPDEAKNTQLRDAIMAIVAASVGSDVLRAGTPANLRAGFGIEPLALEILDGVATPDFGARNELTIAVTEDFTLANPAAIPAGGMAIIYATQDETGHAMTTGSAYRITGEWSAEPGAVNRLYCSFDGGAVIDLDIYQRGEA